MQSRMRNTCTVISSKDTWPFPRDFQQPAVGERSASTGSFSAKWHLPGFGQLQQAGPASLRLTRVPQHRQVKGKQLARGVTNVTRDTGDTVTHREGSRRVRSLRAEDRRFKHSPAL